MPPLSRKRREIRMGIAVPVVLMDLRTDINSLMPRSAASAGLIADGLECLLVVGHRNPRFAMGDIAGLKARASPSHSDQAVVASRGMTSLRMLRPSSEAATVLSS